MSSDELIVLGKIVSVHGLQGAVKVYSFTDPIDNILSYKTWILKRDTECITVKLTKGRLQGKILVANLEGITDIEVARTYAGFEIYIARSELPDLDVNEYYWHQLQGLKVINQQNQCFGLVDHLLETGANDVLVVKPCIDSIDEQERLLPYIDQCIVSIDLAKGELYVDWDAEF